MNNKGNDTNIQTRQYQRINQNNVKSVSLSLATKEEIENWSNGEVTKPETINYKTFKPEKNGLFDEKIFGPVVDHTCPVCGNKYPERANEKQVCEKTDECKIEKPEILPKSTRRSRMGHIKLESPVVHFWFYTINHSLISKILGLKTDGSSKVYSRKKIENIIYFRSHIVLEDGGLKSLPKNLIIEINKAAVTYRKVLLELKDRFEKGSEAFEELEWAIKDLEETASSSIGQDYGVDFYEMNELIEAYSEAKISSGAKAVEYLLKNFDMKAEIKKVKSKIRNISKSLKESKVQQESKIQQRAKLYKRLDVLNKFNNSGQDLKSMIIYNLPVVPADLRPLIQIDGGRHSTSDVNDLYRRIIIRNNRLKKWKENDAPVLIIQNELRMLQEAVDALIDNKRKKPSPVTSKDSRPLKSLSDSLSGKKGRFRQNLLGKRVDYSGRSVIVVGPDLKMHQVGLPRQMAAKLFEPWIVRELVEKEVTSSMKSARKIVEQQSNKIWPYVENVIRDKVVLLNRAPTLHRLSIQAFEPVLVRGKAIKLHPLVTTAFNADFDGDQMAVHVPISPQAIVEARELMLANKNILGPKDGEPIINPSQDMVLGLYYLTLEKADAKGEGRYFGSYEEVMKSYESEHISLHARIALPASSLKESVQNEVDNDYVVTTVGKLIFNNKLPDEFPYVIEGAKTFDIRNNVNPKYVVKSGKNIVEHIKALPLNSGFSKKDIAVIVRKVYDQYSHVISKEQLAMIVKKTTAKKYKKMFEKFQELKDFEGNQIKFVHANSLNDILIKEFEIINIRITQQNEGIERVFELEERVELLEAVWFKYTNMVASVLDNIKELGFTYSTKSGTTMSISDIKVSKIKKKKVDEGNKHIAELKIMTDKGVITDDERYKLVIDKWSEIKEDIQDDLKDIAKTDKENPIFMMMDSGARGNISNFVQLAGLRGLMSNSKKLRRGFAKNAVMVRHTIEVPVKSSFLEGLTSYEFYSSTHGARKGLTDTALNTSNSGYLTRRLVDVAQNIVVREKDCGSEHGSFIEKIVDTKTGTIISSLEERIIGRFTNADVIDSKGKVIVPSDTIILEEQVALISKAKITKVELRTVFGCNTRNGVCQKCYGKDLSTNRLVVLGEPVGVVAAQSIGEPGTQLTMRTFHTGGVAGVQDITGGFTRLMQLIDATKDAWEEKAIISDVWGVVESIIRGKDDDSDKTFITVKSNVEGDKTFIYKFGVNRKIRVKKGQEVKPGSKIVEGPIILHDLLKVAGTRAVQKYLLKEIQKLYKMQGITISDKYIEIIARQFLSKVLVLDEGNSKFFVGTLVDIHEFAEVNAKLIYAGKQPAVGEISINGAKRIPLLSDSFLAAASYQETPTVLVHASIENKKDNLVGLKENIILGHRIPAGTGINNIDQGSKFDIRLPSEYFE